MSGKQQGSVLLLATLVCFAAVFGVSTAKTVTVGGSSGWVIPTSASFYPNWASQQRLLVGDTLVFNFPAGAHTVAQVSKADYDACTTANTIGAVLTTAPSRMTLTSPGTHYFICTIPGHCGANQKVAVTVLAAATPAPKMPPAPSPVTPPIPSPKMAPAPSPMMAPTPSAMSPAPAMSSPAPAPAHVTPSASATPPMPTTSPAASPSEVSGPSAGGAVPPPQGNSAASTGVTLMMMLSIVAAFLVC